MATKNLTVVTTKQTATQPTSTSKQTTTPAVTTTHAPAAVESAAYFKVGDTANYTVGGVVIPVTVVAERTLSSASAQADTVVYTVVADISGNVPSRNSQRGPFNNVTANLLSSR